MKARRRRVWLYSALILLLTCNGVAYVAFGEKVTIGRALGALLGIALLLKVGARGRVSTGGWPGVILLVWMGVSMVIDLALPARSALVIHWMNLASAVVWYYVVANARLSWQEACNAALRAIAIFGAVGVIVLTAKVAHASLWGAVSLMVSTPESGFRLRLLAWEPNIFGAIASMGALMAAAMLGSGRGARRWALVGLPLIAVCVVAAWSKGPLLALAAGASVYMALTRSSRIAINLSGVALAASLGVLVWFAARGGTFSGQEFWRVHNFDVRWLQIIAGFKDIAKSPLFGNGTFSFGQLWPTLHTSFGSSRVATTWIGETVVGVLHDTGAIGVVLFLTFLLGLGISSAHSVRRVPQGADFRERRYFLAALVALYGVLVAMGLATTLYALPIYWATMGLVARVPTWARAVAMSPSAQRPAWTLWGYRDGFGGHSGFRAPGAI